MNIPFNLQVVKEEKCFFLQYEDDDQVEAHHNSKAKKAYKNIHQAR